MLSVHQCFLYHFNFYKGFIFKNKKLMKNIGKKPFSCKNKWREFTIKSCALQMLLKSDVQKQRM